MFKPSTWMGRNALKRLAIVMSDYDNGITEAINDYFSDGTNHGDYLMNILWDWQILELQRLSKVINIDLAMKMIELTKNRSNIMKLTKGHIEDLILPRYVERIKENRNGKYKVIVDTHSSRKEKNGMVISPKFSIDSDLTMRIDELNRDYHNFIANSLGFNIESAVELARINRSSW